jgi:putative ABC transport system permease protein
MEDWAFSIENYVSPNGREVATEQTRFVVGDYFRTLNIPLKAGRLFQAADKTDAPRVAIVSESFARKYWQDGEAVGKRMKLFSRRPENPWITVVGVVGDIRHLGLHTNVEPFIYYPLAQQPQTRMAIVVRSDASPAMPAAIIREEVRKIDAEQAVFGVRTMEEYAMDSIGQFRFTSSILSLIGSLAVILATVGIYGLMAFSTDQRSHEIGVRLALGARRSQIFAHIVGQGMLLAAAGVVFGVIGGTAGGWLIRNQLFGVEPLDPVAMAGSVLVLFGVALTACYFPARRATRIDPTTALRFE